MDAQAEIDAILEKSLSMAFQLLAKHGWHIPFAYVLSSSGEYSIVVAQHPDLPEGAVVPTEQHLASIRAQVSRMSLEGDARAATLVTDIECRFENESAPRPVVKITVDHVSERGATIYYPYSLVDGDVSQQKPVETQPVERFFAHEC